MEEREELVLNARTELENFEAAKVKVDLSVGVISHVEAELVHAVHKEGVKVEQFSISEEKEVLAKKTLWVRSGHFNVECEFSSRDILNIKIETAASEMGGRI